MNLYDLTEEMMKIGYEPDDARARVCQDIVLKALSLSPLSRNATIKGGVVMRSITDNVRRATQDMDIAFDNEGASLLINSREQMFSEKLRSLLKFGTFSTRYKDINDMFYQCGKLNEKNLISCFQILIFGDSGMRACVTPMNRKYNLMISLSYILFCKQF